MESNEKLGFALRAQKKLKLFLATTFYTKKVKSIPKQNPVLESNEKVPIFLQLAIGNTNFPNGKTNFPIGNTSFRGTWAHEKVPDAKVDLDAKGVDLDAKVDFVCNLLGV